MGAAMLHVYAVVGLIGGIGGRGVVVSCSHGYGYWEGKGCWEEKYWWRMGLCVRVRFDLRPFFGNSLAGGGFIYGSAVRSNLLSFYSPVGFLLPEWQADIIGCPSFAVAGSGISVGAICKVAVTSAVKCRRVGDCLCGTCGVKAIRPRSGPQGAETLLVEWLANTATYRERPAGLFNPYVRSHGLWPRHRDFLMLV